jgi:LacI family transcriptional regulator
VPEKDNDMARTEPPAAPTLTEVAAAAGVGRATVARTLGGYGSVSARTREKVLAAAERLGYATNQLAKSMTTGRTNTIGVVIADVGNPFFAGILSGIATSARAQGYDILMISTGEKIAEERRAVETLLGKQVDGIVIASAAGRSDAVPHLVGALHRGCPVVLIDRALEAIDADTVVTDNRAVSAAVVASLIARGHRRIAFVWGPVTNKPAVDLDDVPDVVSDTLWSDGERLLGYTDALRDNAVPFDTALVSHSLQTESQATRAVAAMLDLANPPTAVFATEADAVTGTLRALRRRGLSCPEDVSIVGFDDSSWAEVMSPPMTVVAQPMQAMGAAAADAVVARIEGAGGPVERIEISSAIIERGSVASRPS